MKYSTLLFYFLSLGKQGYNNNNNINSNINRIKNNELPACRTCIYYKPPSMRERLFHDYDNEGRCKLFGTKDVVSGVITYKPADICRMHDAECGMNGTYYVSKKDIYHDLFTSIFRSNIVYYI